MSSAGEAGLSELVRLADLVRTLRARCPWDRRQTHASLAPHLLEESYELLDAIDALARAEPSVPDGVVAHLEEELGDVLFQVFFHAELAEEEGRFTLADVARTIHDKLVGRHPHVFGDASADTPEEVAARWEVLKTEEKKRRPVTEAAPLSMPALALASKVLRKADSLGVLRPPSEAAANVEAVTAALAKADPTLEDEAVDRWDRFDQVGEMLLAAAQLARRAGVDPESALRSAVHRLQEQVESPT